MNYRKFAAADMDVSLLGFGAMRLPTLPEDPDKIDEAETIRMIRHAIDNGVNYIDTAYVYYDQNSEKAVGKALADGYREKTLVATKMPFWIIQSPDAMESIFDEQIANLGVGCIDMYLMHAITDDRWDTVLDWKIWDFIEKQRAAGKVRFIGFSYHGSTPGLFKTILDRYPWDFCQLQYNYMDKDIQCGIEGFEYAVEKGVPIVVMEPLKGGNLTDIVPPSIQKYWDELGSGRSPAEWALRWVANLPGVLTILSGMSAMAQVEENIKILSDADADIGKLSAGELAVIDRIAEEYNKLLICPCTGCNYCMPCPEGLNIPKFLELRNSYNLYGENEKVRESYGWNIPPKASDCISCGQCEEKCPQHIGIIQFMREIAELFE